MFGALTNLKFYAVAFLFVALAVWASQQIMLDKTHGNTEGANDFGSTQRLWSVGDFDTGGTYPAQDCGRNYGLQMHIVNQMPCTVNVQRAEKIDDQALAEMRADGNSAFDNAADALDTFYDYVGRVLERVASSW